ncbi:MAG TPA: glycoside hydrolase domain-containing protein [Gemmatimonadaceae bacterium]|nr:glycoside hydrolase domain-containing protein [Gemmatimonadaceae bacterium]
MPLHGHVFTGIRGIRGFDANATITAGIAAAFAAHGYHFCVRYIRRDAVHAHDLSATEATTILDAGLALMPVQHVESEEAWIPSMGKGAANGEAAAMDATAIGVPSGVTVWCDLEGVAVGTPAQDVIDYCNRWHSVVAGAGFVPGLYVGFHAGLNPNQLYRSLRFSHYWAAYNLNSDQAPAIRGVQMKQAVPKPLDRVPGTIVEFQVDTIRGDALGGMPTLVGPDRWMELLA